MKKGISPLQRPTRHYLVSRLSAVSRREVLRALRRHMRSGRMKTVRSITTDAGGEFLTARFPKPSPGSPFFTPTPAPPGKRDRLKTAAATSGVSTPSRPTSAASPSLEHISIDLSDFSRCFLFLNFTLSARRSVATARLKSLSKAKSPCGCRGFFVYRYWM